MEQLTHPDLSPSSQPGPGSGAAGPHRSRLPAAADQKPARASLVALWARHLDEVREAQRLHHQVFAGEMGACLQTPANAGLPGHVVDRFDDYCEHLLVRDVASGQVVGTCRVLTPVQALRCGGAYTEAAFDLSALHNLRAAMVELDRGCVHADYRHGGVLMTLGAALFAFMVQNRFESMIGCASVPMLHRGMVSGDAAASIWNQLRQTHLAPAALQVRPLHPLPLDGLDAALLVEPPAMLKGCLRLGAKVLGPPAWDPMFNTADLPIMARIADLPPRYRKHFLGA